MRKARRTAKANVGVGRKQKKYSGVTSSAVMVQISKQTNKLKFSSEKFLKVEALKKLRR